MFIIFHALIYFKDIYNDGYVDTIISNWNKNPIIDIEINNLNNSDSIGFFKNFKGEKSKNIYKWKNKTFYFKRMERKYSFFKILKNEQIIKYVEKTI